jgi:hypothetical protein
MEWRHYEVRQSDDCEVQGHDGTSMARFTIGIVETGKQRVFAGHFVRKRGVEAADYAACAVG